MKIGENIYFLSEDERKYTFNKIEKEVIFPKEVIVCQWYDTIDPELETKLVFRLLSGTYSWTKIRKKRTSDTHADKTIEYVDSVPFDQLLGSPYLCKRRSVVGNIYVDKFIINNGTCCRMLENEGDDNELNQFVKTYRIDKLSEVTSKIEYHSKSLAIPFTLSHLTELKLFFNVFTNNYDK